MKNIINAMLRRYDAASHELKGRVRIYLYFSFGIMPILVVFITFMNIIAPRSPFQALNLVVFGVIFMLAGGLLLVARGYYNIAVTIFTFSVMAGLIFNAIGTERHGNAERYVASMFSFIMPVLFSTLFCRRWVYVVVSIIAQTALVYCVVASAIIDPGVKGVIMGSMSLTLVISFIIGLILNRLHETTRRLRSEETERERMRQSAINEGLMVSMRDVSARLDDSSLELSRNAGGFARNIQNQAAAIEEITATMEEISAGSDQVSESARTQSEAMARLMELMDALSRITGEMEGRIGATLNRTEQIAATARSGEAHIIRMDESMSAVGATSKEMSGILGIINEISDRINLLSLNASIEAARAGEYGRGFAVVADEIAKLAEQTSTSVKEIDTLIRKSDEEVRKGTAGVQDTVTVIREILAGVEENNSMIAGVSAGMGSYIESNRKAHDEVRGVRARSDEIDHATRDQKIAAEEVVGTITNINQMSQANASAAEDITGHSRAIADMAKDLKEKIASFEGDAVVEEEGDEIAAS
ncbi:MAG: hypothetical protein JW838_03965 [Spirochaetes bacterium]|nr:hypothetical protein [Spirochaetota bacterium]